MYDAPQIVGELHAQKRIATRENQPFLSFEFALFLCVYEALCVLWVFGLAVDGAVRWFLQRPVV
jgi:hypothetical protein